MLITRNDATIDFNHVEIQTNRLRLRAVAIDDATDIFREFTAQITRYMLPSPPSDVQQILTFINTSRDKMHNSEELVMAILLQETQEFIGVCGLHNNFSNGEYEVGIWLKQNVHGQGLGREAMHAFVQWIGQHLQLDELIYPVHENNIASRRIAESLGGIVFRHGRRTSHSGKELDEVVYRIAIGESGDG